MSIGVPNFSAGVPSGTPKTYKVTPMGSYHSPPPHARPRYENRRARARVNTPYESELIPVKMYNTT